MRISDWSSDVCSSDLLTFDDGSSTRLDCTYPVDGDSWRAIAIGKLTAFAGDRIDVERVVAIVETLEHEETVEPLIAALGADFDSLHRQPTTASTGCQDRRDRALKKRSEEHTSELQSLMRNSYAVFSLKKQTKRNRQNHSTK